MNPWWKRTEDDGGANDSASETTTQTDKNDSSTPEATESSSTETQTAAQASEKPRPRTRRRRSPATRKASATDADGDEAPAEKVDGPGPADDRGPADGETSATAGSDRPRRTRRRRSTATRRASTADADAQETSVEKAEDPSLTADDKPKRTRRRTTRRHTSATAETGSEPSSEARGSEEGEEDAPKRPARRRQPRARRTSTAAEPATAPAPLPPTDVVEALRELLTAAPDRSRSDSDERKIALFCDLENIALGVKDSEIGKFDINLVLERLLEKGKIMVKKAYADWERYSGLKKDLHQAAIELIEIPQRSYTGKNSADIKMVVDVMEVSELKGHLDTFVILSGDSDFSPLVSKLKERDKHVIGVGVKNSSSKLLIDNCDEFIFYEDIWRDSQAAPKLEGLDKKQTELFSLMSDAIQALIRENKDILWGSMIKQTIQRKRPSFNEGYFGYRSFSELLEDAASRNIINLRKDSRSGSYIVTGFGTNK